MPGGVDDVGLAFHAHADARDHVPDELEVHLGDGERCRHAPAAYGDRHVRLGALAEIDGPEPGLARLRFLESRFLRPVAVRAGRVHGKPRHGHFLASVGVDLAHVGDRGDDAQELQELEAALLGPARAQLEERGERDLLLDLPHELLDASRCGDRLLALQRGERVGVLLVREVKADRARDQQRAADQRDDEDEVLEEEPASMEPLRGRRGRLGGLRDRGRPSGDPAHPFTR